LQLIQAVPIRATAGDAFEDVLYGSESEVDDSDEEAHQPRQQPLKKAHGQGGARLRMDDDEPMDLLHGAAAKISTSRSGRRKKPGQDASHFKTDLESGKMVIDSDDGSDEDASTAFGHVREDDIGGAAYRESLTSVDGFSRGPNGRVKFHKDTRKRRREAVDAEQDVEMDDAAVAGVSPAKKPKSREQPRLGHEFKAKKAGGDVKKGGVDPYAYLSLSQAAKRRVGKGARIGIASKK
jgi:ribosomal RNA-processing protein 12